MNYAQNAELDFNRSKILCMIKVDESKWLIESEDQDDLVSFRTFLFM